MRKLQRLGRILVAGLLVGAFALTGSPAQAAPDPGPPPPGERLEGPPRSQVLAVDPATVSPPGPAVTTRAVACPPAGYGVNRTAPGAGLTVALTFDDGPGAGTESVIRILQEEGVTATFFNIGVNMTVRPGVVQAEATQGFLLGNHTWSHPDLTTLPTAAAQGAEIDNATNQQAALVGFGPCVFRPPYGAYNNTTLDVALARNLSVWNWSVDTEDWRAGTSVSSSWINQIISLAQAGAAQQHPVILMHNMPHGSPATVAALPSIISFYRDRGYVFVDLLGEVADRPVAGDWDGNGTVTPGIVRGSTWYLRNSNTAGPPDIVFGYGRASDRVVTGDWDGNGTTTPGIVRGNTWYLRNSNTPGPGEIGFGYGRSTDRTVTGDWDGNGTTTPGIVRGNTWYLRNSNTAGPGEIGFSYGRSTDRMVTGDWDGNGTTTPGVVRDKTWYLRTTNNPGDPSAAAVAYGIATDIPVTGDWDGNGSWTVGVVRGVTWYLRNSNTGGPAEWGVVYAV
jgi:peptidoglycan/xylan/chitin deacetylase (PgdA/CDA1 family)